MRAVRDVLEGARAVAARRAPARDPEAEREAFEERAAIIEYDGKRPRAEAERWARECLRRVRGAV